LEYLWELKTELINVVQVKGKELTVFGRLNGELSLLKKALVPCYGLVLFGFRLFTIGFEKREILT
jgi:hypothetical protein